ncbi:C6 transcription factor [Colletotrichum higginsianum IMI 349063]|uniref:C6 transcription factor n=2 Tax=Colletotrichum higginsianum (strain IMI 349063) TaxID=759273 RepID=A0A1B7YDJ0_COLHI|nr:C6 transcription factor [Colletotrichum higginsianum IMI 349063]OBR10102.1 C6 transcription factor [Colletotrichum higginsianum IMI 349063]
MSSFVLTRNQEIPQSLSLKQYDARDPMNDKSYSSWTYLIDLCRLCGELILPMPTLPPGLLSNTIDRADSRIVSWLITLPKWKQHLVDSEGTVDMILFHAISYAHDLRIKMQLPLGASEFGIQDILTLGPLFGNRDLLPPMIPRSLASPYPWFECSTALQAGITTISLFNFSFPPARYSPACIMGLQRASLPLLNARVYGKTGSPVLQEKLDLLLGVLKVAGDVWPVARNIGSEMSDVLRDANTTYQRNVVSGFSSSLGAFVTGMASSGSVQHPDMFPFSDPRTAEELFRWSPGFM